MNTLVEAFAPKIFATADAIELEIKRLGLWKEGVREHVSEAFEDWLQNEYLPFIRETARRGVCPRHPEFSLMQARLAGYERAHDIEGAQHLNKLLGEMVRLGWNIRP